MILESLFNQPAYMQISVAAISAISALLGVVISQSIQYLNNKSRCAHDLNIKRLESEIRKQDGIHGLQLHALKELSKIHLLVLPNVWLHPNFEYEDALGDVLQSMGNLIEQLNMYLMEFGYIVPDHVNDKINDVIYQCNKSHWGISTSDSPGYEPNSQEIESANEVIKALSGAVSLFKTYLNVIK